MIISCIIGAAIASLVICVGITDCSRQDEKPFVQTKATNSSILTETMETVTVAEDTMATITVPADTMATITVAADIRCHNHFVHLSTGCYFFSPSHELKSWHEAYHYCRTLHQGISRLVIIDSQQVQDVIVTYLKTQHTPAELSLTYITDASY